MTIVVAHAGASGHAPANTVGAYRRAHATYDGVWMEFDTQFASDDQLVAVHDDTLDRTTDWTGFVADHSSTELKKCNAAAKFDGWDDFEPVVTVREILEEGRDSGWRLIAEIKNIPGQRTFDPSGERYAQGFNALLTETKFPLDRLVAICFWAPTLDELKKLNGDVALGYLTSTRYTTASQNLDICLEHGFHVAAPEHVTPDLTRELVDQIHDKGIQVHAWTTNEPAHIDAAVSKNLDGITSDYPERVYEALSRATAP